MEAANTLAIIGLCFALLLILDKLGEVETKADIGVGAWRRVDGLIESANKSDKPTRKPARKPATRGMGNG